MRLAIVGSRVKQGKDFWGVIPNRSESSKGKTMRNVDRVIPRVDGSVKEKKHGWHGDNGEHGE